MQNVSLKAGVISPQDWGLPVAEAGSQAPLEGLGVSPADLEQRLRANTYEWLLRQFNWEAGAFNGFYRAAQQSFEPPQTVNLIAPWQLLAAYDRYGDEQLLHLARQATDWFYRNFVVSHPMSVVIGGVREGARPELWTKFSAEFVLLTLGVFRRTGEPRYAGWARQSAGFLAQSARHEFAPKYDEQREAWRANGWQSFGRVIEACLEMEQITSEATWGEQALAWGEYGLSLQAADGGYYLIDGDYFNTDIAADELRALVFLYERTGQARYLEAARRFGEWLAARQREDGSWPLTIDRDANIVVSTAGPGDIPNIAVALLRLGLSDGGQRYRQAIERAFRYSLAMQVVPGSAHPYIDDPHVRWGYWSWDPYYDFSLSADQSTHHARGIMFLLDSGFGIPAGP